MKKLLNILAGITLIASGTSSLTAFKNSHSQQKTVTNISNAHVQKRKQTQDNIDQWDAFYWLSPVKIGGTYYESTDTGIFTSKDGVTWNRNEAQGIPTFENWFESNVTKIGNIYYAASVVGGLYYSTDGIHWTHDTYGINQYSAVDSPPVKIGGAYYVATDGVWDTNSLHKSTDGIHWTSAANGLPSNAYISGSPVKIGGTYYLGMYRNGTAKREGLYTSQDGTNWTPVISIPPKTYIYSYPVKIGDTYYLPTEGSGLWTSTDGVNWTHNKTIPAGAIIQSPPNKIGDTYYLGTWQNGLWTSSNGVNWTKDTHGLKGNYRFEEPPTKIGDTYYAASWYGLFTSVDGINWTKDTKGLPSDADPEVNPTKIGDTYYVGSQLEGLFGSKDGKTWKLLVD